MITAEIREGESFFAFVNVRNFSFSKSEKEKAKKHIQELRGKAESDPSGRSFVLVGGDFNVTEAGEGATGLHSHQECDFLNTEASNPTEQRHWQAVLQGFTEFHQYAPTRLGVHKEKDSEDEEAEEQSHVVATRIDRLYWSQPAWQTMLYKVETKTGNNRLYGTL